MKIKLFALAKKIVILLALVFPLSQCKTETPTRGNLESDFLNPPTENRPLAFWDWLNGYVDTTKMAYELNEMKAKGMQGAFIWDVGALSDPKKMIPAGPPFLGEKSLEAIARALKTAAKLGLNLGMITSSSWNAGGDWIGDEDAAKELLCVNQSVEGPSVKKITIGIPKSPRGEAKVYSLVTSMAIPYSPDRKIEYSNLKIISLDQFTSKENSITWDVPEGKWEILSFFMCNTGQELECPSPNSKGLMIDHLSKNATQLHFDTIINRLERITTPENALKYLEVDSYEVWPATDWTPRLIEEFKSRFGYDPIPYLPLLTGYTANDSILATRFTGDYRRLLSDLMIENHFELGTKITNKHGMKLFAEGGHGGYPRVDPLKAMGHTDVPMGEFWNRQQFWVTKEAASAAHIYGKKIVASESLTGWQNWQHGPTDYKQLCDIAFCEGLNQVFFHTFAHNPEIAGKPGFAYHAGEHLNVNATWWEMARPFMDYLSRCSYLLRQGNFVGDACLYYGDQAPNLVPPKRIDPNIAPLYADSRCLHCGQPKPVNPGELAGYDFDYINAEIITTTLKTKNGKLVLPNGQSYRVMLLPDRTDISLEVLRSLEKLVYNGAVVIGRRPERTTSLKNYPECDSEVKAISEKLWRKCDGKTIFSNVYGKGKVYSGKTLKQVLGELNVAPDFDVKGIDNSDWKIDFIHRQTAEEDIYFVSNSSESEQQFTAVFRVNGNQIPELWDAETGMVQRNIAYSKTKNGIQIELVMDPLASRFVVFRNQSGGKNDADLTYDLQYGFHRATKASESIDITANWELHFNTKMGGPESFRMNKLMSWTEANDEGVKYYSGKATYTREFVVEAHSMGNGQDAFAVFENIQEMARVQVNGHDCGIVWTPPYKTNITPYLKAGKNTMTVEVINTWNNRIVGDVINPAGKQYTQTNIKYKFKADKPLLKSGLTGKAEIVFVTN